MSKKEKKKVQSRKRIKERVQSRKMKRDREGVQSRKWRKMECNLGCKTEKYISNGLLRIRLLTLLGGDRRAMEAVMYS